MSLFVSPRDGTDTSLRVKGPKVGAARTVGFSDGVGEVGVGEDGRASGGGEVVGSDEYGFSCALSLLHTARAHCGIARKSSAAGELSVQTEDVKALITVTTESFPFLAEGFMLTNTKQQKTLAKLIARTILSAAENRVGPSQRGPASATAGGGSIATTSSAPTQSKKGASVFSSGSLALAIPAPSITTLAPPKTTLLQLGDAVVSFVQVWTSCSRTRHAKYSGTAGRSESKTTFRPATLARRIGLKMQTHPAIVERVSVRTAETA